MIYNSAEDLWRFLVSRSGLDVGTTGRASSAKNSPYDSGLVADLRARLFSQAQEPIEQLLKTARPPISAETLLRAFLQALQPFSMMKVDILGLLSAAGSRRSDSNIKICFNFHPSDDPLELLLIDFREQLEVIEKHTMEVATRTWEPPLLSRIPHVAEALVGGQTDLPKVPLAPGDERIIDWIARYRLYDRYEALPELQPTGIGEIDSQIDIVSELLQDMLAAFRRHGDNRKTFAAAASEARGGRTIDPIGMGVPELWLTESDYWAGAVAGWLLNVRAAALANVSARSSLIDEVTSKLHEIIPPASGPKSAIEVLQRRLEDVLNLPVWKKRNEVYAVWVGSQIWRALKDQWEFRFHVCDHTLSFAFRGVHLATLVGPAPNDIVLWWTEMRTTARNLPSGKRSVGIQPDYRLRRVPLSDVQPDLLVLEVKQYKQSNKSNFSAAIEDYAFACPKAEIMLANYGPVSAGVLGALSKKARRRTTAYSHVRPDRDEGCRQLREGIGRVVTFFREARPPPGEHSPQITNSDHPTRPAGSGRIQRVELTWGKSPRDLDLHLIGDDSHIYYEAPTHGMEVEYHGDIVTGFGPEIISITASQSTFLVCVHQFSSDGLLSASDATVKIWHSFENEVNETTLHCPTHGTGHWWLVCRIDCSTGTITPIDMLPPFFL